MTPRVVFISGWGRSGSTLLGNVLGSARGAFSAGELRFIWDRGFVEDRLCGCGSRFSACPLWREVVVRAFGRHDDIPVRELIALRERHQRTRHLAGLYAPAAAREGAEPLAPYTDALRRLYGAIAEVTGAEVIVDASKFPSHALSLARGAGFPLRLLHLVRDPRAVAFSWQRRKAEVDGAPSGEMPRISTLRSSLLWLAFNVGSERVGAAAAERYARLRYEDFTAAPRRTVGVLCAALGVDGGSIAFAGESSVTLPGNHTISGNPGRFAAGPVTVAADDEWRRRSRRRADLLVVAATWPLMLRYGYPLRAPRRADGDARRAAGRE